MFFKKRCFSFEQKCRDVKKDNFEIKNLIYTTKRQFNKNFSNPNFREDFYKEFPFWDYEIENIFYGKFMGALPPELCILTLYFINLKNNEVYLVADSHFYNLINTMKIDHYYKLDYSAGILKEIKADDFYRPLNCEF